MQTTTAAQEAIANADAYLGDAVLPTYTELLAALRSLTDWGREHTGPSQPHSPHDLLVASHDLLTRHDKTMAGDFGPPAAAEAAKAEPAPAPGADPIPAGNTVFKMATYAHNAGRVRPCGDPFVSVVCVTYEDRNSDIVFVKFTQDYSTRNARPYKLRQSGRQFGSLKSAVAALKKERAIG